MAKETPTNRLLPVRRSFRQGGFGDKLKWLRDLTEDKPESRGLSPTPLFRIVSEQPPNWTLKQEL
jgi:hypothetical protein